MLNVRILILFVAVFVSSACVKYHPQSKLPLGSHESLSKRAAFDFQCSEQELTFNRLGYDTQGVSGCGQRAVYVSSVGKWILNSVDQPTKSPVTPNESAPTSPSEGPSIEQVRSDVNCIDGEVKNVGGLGTKTEVVIRQVEACGKLYSYNKSNDVWVLIKEAK